MINKKPLIKFIIWVTIFFVLVFIGVNNIFALETKTIYSSNSSGTLSNSNKYTYGFLNQGGVQTTSSASVNTTVNGRALALIYYMYEPVQLNHTYTMVVDFMSNDLINTFTSNMVQVATCNGEICNDNAIVSVVKNNPNGYSNKLTIQFNPVTSGSILLVNLSDKTATRYITGAYDNQYFGIKSVTLDNVNANQDIINNQTNNTNNIINNNNSNASAIMENQNQNTQDMINSQNVCQRIDKNNIEITSHYLDRNGNEVSYNDWGITNYIKIDSNTKIKVLETHTVSGNGTVTSCFYNVNKTLISCQYQGIYNIGDYITIPNNAEYVRFNIRSSTNKPQLEICKNGNQAISDNLQDLNDNIKDDNIDDNGVADAFDNFNDYLDDNSTITQLITLPITLYTAILNNVNGTCQPFNLGNLYGENLTLPCINISQYLGNSLWTMIDVIISGFAVFAISKKMIKVFNNFSSLREGDVIDD